MVNINRLMLFIFLWKVPNELNIAFQFILILENYIQTDKLCHCIWNNFMALHQGSFLIFSLLGPNALLISLLLLRLELHSALPEKKIFITNFA